MIWVINMLMNFYMLMQSCKIRCKNQLPLISQLLVYIVATSEASKAMMMLLWYVTTKSLQPVTAAISTSGTKKRQKNVHVVMKTKMAAMMIASLSMITLVSSVASHRMGLSIDFMKFAEASEIAGNFWLITCYAPNASA